MVTLRKDKLAEWIRGWKLAPRDASDHSVDAHNAAIDMVIDQLYDPEESGAIDELLNDSTQPAKGEIGLLAGFECEETSGCPSTGQPSGNCIRCGQPFLRPIHNPKAHIEGVHFFTSEPPSPRDKVNANAIVELREVAGKRTTKPFRRK